MDGNGGGAADNKEDEEDEEAEAAAWLFSVIDNTWSCWAEGSSLQMLSASIF